MEKISDRELARRLRHFDAVWRRVTASRAPQETANRCGVKLMPRQNRCPRCQGRRP